MESVNPTPENCIAAGRGSNCEEDSTIVDAFNPSVAIQIIKGLDVLNEIASPCNVEYFRQHSDDSGLSKLLSVQQELGEEYWSAFQIFFEKTWWCVQMILFCNSNETAIPVEFVDYLYKHFTTYIRETADKISVGIMKAGLHVYLEQSISILEDIDLPRPHDIIFILEPVEDGCGWYMSFPSAVEDELGFQAMDKFAIKHERLPKNWEPPEIVVPSECFPISRFPEFAVKQYYRNQLSNRFFDALWTPVSTPSIKLLKHLDYTHQYFQNRRGEEENATVSEYADFLMDMKKFVQANANRNEYLDKLDEVLQYLQDNQHKSDEERVTLHFY